jgi:hypothetical protein
MERPALDIIVILTPAFQNLLWLLPVLVVVTLLKSSWLKGWLGEQLVRLYAPWTLDKRVYRRFHDITLDTPDGTTQIGHVFLSPLGIFVLETKNMKGWIYGGGAPVAMDACNIARR